MSLAVGCSEPSGPMPPDEDPIAEAAYDAIASTYADDVESNAYNAHLEFPATTDLIPAVDGRHVLDAGCGTGVYTEWLREEGADVTAVDVSREMLDEARERVSSASDGDGGLDDDTWDGGPDPDDVTFHRANLGAPPFEFADADAFDGIVSALVLGYIEEWRPVFEEFARILRPGGFVVFSTGHPMNEFPLDDGDLELGERNYFDVEAAVKDWAVDVPYYRRPFGEVCNPVIEAGFQLDAVVEPRPTAEFERERPDRYDKESRYPVFLVIRASLPPAD